MDVPYERLEWRDTERHVDGTLAERTRVAVSYDPVNHIAEATIGGNLVAAVPYTAPAIRYVGAEGNTNADVDNFSVWSGSATDAMPGSIGAPSPPNDVTRF